MILPVGASTPPIHLSSPQWMAPEQFAAEMARPKSPKVLSLRVTGSISSTVVAFVGIP